jgi:hypothetical protein
MGSIDLQTPGGGRKAHLIILKSDLVSRHHSRLRGQGRSPVPAGRKSAGNGQTAKQGVAAHLHGGSRHIQSLSPVRQSLAFSPLPPLQANIR